MILRSKAMQSSILSWTCQISDCSEHVTQCFQKSGFRDLIKKTDSDCHPFQSSGRTFTRWTLKARLSVRLFKPGEAFGFEVFHEKLHQKNNLMEHSIVIWWVDGCCQVSFCQKPRLGISTLVVTMRNQVFWPMTPWLVTGTYSNLFTGSVFSTNSPCTSTKLSSCRQPMVFYVDIKENGNLWQQLQKTGGPKKTGIKKWQAKTGRHKHHCRFVPRPLAS